MKERPILFSAPMVQAILTGNKTQTRRVIKWPLMDKTQWFELDQSYGIELANPSSPIDHLCPYGKIGDQLWVRENGWERPERTRQMMREGADTWKPYYYDADGLNEHDVDDFKSWGFKRRPSIHMPRWASRIQLEITNIRVERLQDISRADAIAEGIKRSGLTINGISEGDHFYDYEMKTEDMCEWFTNPIASFQSLWHSINGPDSWTANPWVWVIEFKRVERPA